MAVSGLMSTVNFFAGGTASIGVVRASGINQDGHTHASMTCPSCAHEFTVDITGGAKGES